MKVTLSFTRKSKKPETYTNVQSAHHSSNTGSALLKWPGRELEFSGVKCLHVYTEEPDA